MSLFSKKVECSFNTGLSNALNIETERHNLKTTPTGGENNPTVSIDFVLREAASLSFLAYNKK